MSKYFMGIDVGTYESKGVIINEKAEIVATEVAKHGMENPQPNYFEHDADAVWYADVCKISNSLLRTTGIRAEEVVGLGISALGADCVPVDKDCKPLRKAILYGIDARATEEMKLLTEMWGEDTVLKCFGRPLGSSDVAPKILWIKRNEPEVYAKTHKFLTASSYLVAKITGNYTVDRFLGLASFNPLYNSDGTPNPEFCEGVCRPDQLADVMWTTDVAGYVTEKASLETGLAVGTPVIAGGDDSGAEAISCGVMTAGDMMVQMGSTIYMILCTDRLYDDDRLWREAFIVPGSYDISAGTNTGGSLTRWVLNTLFPDFLVKEHETGVNGYEQMMKAMKEVPAGSRGLITLPYFAGERTPINDPLAKGMIFGLNISHTREDIMRSAFESICYSIRQHFEIFEELGVHIKEVMVTGGGVKNDLWMQMLADITGLVLRTPEITLGASYGDALMVMIGTGFMESFEECRKLIRAGKSYEPCDADKEVYDLQYKLYKRLYEQTKDLMHELT